MANQTVTTATFRAEEQGVEQTAAALGKLQGAAGGAAKATDEFNRSTDTSAKKIGTIEREVDRLQRQLAGAPAAWSAYERGMRAATNGLDAGKLTVEQYQRSIQQLQQQLQRVVAPNLRMDVDATGLSSLLGNTQKVSAAQREAATQALRNAQAQQVAIKDQADAQAKLATAVAKLRAEIDPMAVAQSRLNDELAEYNNLARAGAISNDELAKASGLANERFRQATRNLNEANDNLALAGHQLGNLRSQAIDVGTMYFGGASLGQIAATQSGQIYEAIAGHKGIKTGLQELKGSAVSAFTSVIQFLGPGGLIVAGATAAASAVVLFGTKAEDRMERVTKAASGFRDTLAEIRKGNADLADMIERVSDASGRLTPTDVRNKLAADIQAQRRAIEEARQGAGQAALSTGGWNPIQTAKDAYNLAAGKTSSVTIAGLADGFLRGSKSAQTLRSEMLALQAAVDTPSYLRDSIDQVLAFADAAIKAEGDIRGFEIALTRLRAEASRTRFDEASSALTGLLPDVSEAEKIERSYQAVLGRIAQLRRDNQEVDRDGLRETERRKRDAALAELSRPARESLKAVQDSLNNLDLSPVQRQIAETTQEYDRRIAEYRRTTNSAAGLADLQAEKEAALQIVVRESARAEEARRAGYSLDLASVNDITAAQKAATAGQRAYNDAIAAGQSVSYAHDRQAEASALSMAQARQQLSEAGRQQELATQRQIEQARLEYDLVGRSAGEVARLRAEFDMLAQAKDAARAAGFDDAQVALTDEMRRQAAEVGRLTEATQRLNFERDLLFDRQQATRSPEDQRIAEQLRAIGVDFESAQGRADAAQLRLNNRLHETNDALYEMRDAGKAAILDLVDAIGSGEDALGAFASAFAGLGKQMASAGLDKIMNALLGGSTGGARPAANDNRGGIVGAIVSAVGGGSIPTPTARPTYQSPSYPYSGKYALPSGTPGAQAQAAALAQTVTQSVSSNLLTSMLGAGKSRAHITGLNKDFASALTNMFEAAPQAVKASLTINSGFRSVARQAELFDAALKKYGSVAAARKMVAPPGRSQHNFGMAADLGYGTTSAKQWVHQNAGQFGLKFPMGWEDWHIELASARNGSRSASAAYTDQKIVSKGVAEGLKDYTRQLAPMDGGYVGTGSRGGVPVPTARPGSSSAAGFFGKQIAAPGSFLGIEHGGLTVGQGLGTAAGAFASGYQGGNAISGALGGAMAGVAGGPIGMAIGALAGAIGGGLGGRAQRKEAHRQAAADWKAIQPQYAEFDRSITGEGQGQLREWLTSTMGQFDQFVAVGAKAWKSGAAAIIAQTTATGAKIWAEFDRKLTEFRDGFEPLVEDMMSGEGLGGAFSKGRAATRDLRKQIQGMIDDVSIAFGSDDIGQPVAGFYSESATAWEEARNAALEKAKKAAGEYALSLLYTAETNSEVEKALDGFRGTAAGLQKVLVELGWTADKAASDIDARLNQAIAEMGKTFVDGYQRQINDFQGTGYLNDAADLIKARDTALKDAKLLGVDPEIVSRWFKLASQDLVDGGELVGSAFDDLIKAFPELSGVVHAFTGATRTAAEAAKAAQQASFAAYETARTQIQDVFQTVLSYRDNLRSFQDQLKVSDSSTLSQADQVKEAQRLYDETLGKANAGDKDAMNGLTGAAGDLLSKAKDYFKSSPEYVRIFESVSASLKVAEGKATSQLDTMKSQVAWLSDIAESNLNIEKSLADYLQAQKDMNANRSWGVMADQNKAIWGDLYKQGINYTGNFGGGQFLDWVKTQLPSQQAVINAIIDKWSAVYAPKAKMRFGGIVGAYAGGGVVGNGIWDRDSVLARYAGGGEIALAGGEGVVNAPAMNKPGVAAMVARLNRGVPDPYPRTEMLRRQAANVNAEGAFASRGDMRDVTSRLDRIVDTLVEGFGGSIEATNRLSSNAQQSAYAARRAAIKAGKAA